MACGNMQGQDQKSIDASQNLVSAQDFIFRSNKTQSLAVKHDIPDDDIDGKVAPLKNLRSRCRKVKFDSNELKANGGESGTDNTAGEVEGNEVERHCHLGSATTSGLIQDYEWGIREIIGKKVVRGQI